MCKRAIASLLTIQIVYDINNDQYKESLDVVLPLLKKYGVDKDLNSKEKRIIDGSYNDQDLYDMDMEYESYWALCWCLGLVDDIKDGGTFCDCDKSINFVISSKSFDEFKNKCKLRSKEEILDMQDLYYRYHWLINQSKIDNTTKIGDLNPSIVIERRRALEWVISKGSDLYSENDWYTRQLHA